MTDHPITPPPELVQQWMTEERSQDYFCITEQVAHRAAQWGADQELEACCKLLELSFEWDVSACEDLRAERRSPASLKEQSLKHLEVMERDGYYLPEITDTIRRAIESIPDPS